MTGPCMNADPLLANPVLRMTGNACLR